MNAPIFPLTFSAMQLYRLSRDYRNQLNKKKLHSINSSPAVLISPGLLSRCSPKHLSRAWLFVLPHLNNVDTGSTLYRSLEVLTSPPPRKWSGQHLILQCPSPFGVLRRPFGQPCHLVCLRGTAVSGERISQGPPGNVVALGCPTPPRRVSERSVQMFPIGLPFQDIVLTAQLHINTETSLERLVPLVEIWQRGNFCQYISPPSRFW